MRTIKFRGRRIDNGEWVYGYFVGTTDSVAIIIPFEKVNYDVGYIGESECCYCLPETIGQFTGLYDKNGKEIYEGDIYRYDNPDSINEVSYCAGGGFAGFDLTPAIHSENRLLDVEVIGNIHDNPELLKGGKE